MRCTLLWDVLLVVRDNKKRLVCARDVCESRCCCCCSVRNSATRRRRQKGSRLILCLDVLSQLCPFGIWWHELLVNHEVLRWFMAVVHHSSLKAVSGEVGSRATAESKANRLRKYTRSSVIIQSCCNMVRAAMWHLGCDINWIVSLK